MALELQLDSIDGLDDSLKSLYREENGKFFLDVKGVEDTSGLKNALKSERNNASALQKENSALKARIEAQEKKKQEENSEFEKLWTSEKERAKSLAERLANSEKSRFAKNIVSKLGVTGKAAEMIESEVINNYVDYDSDSNTANLRKTTGFFEIDQVVGQIKKDFDFIKFENQSSGGGSKGNNSDQGQGKPKMERADWEKLPPHEKWQAARTHTIIN